MEQTIPYMTTSMIADYCGVSKDTIKRRYIAYKEEFDKLGVMILKPFEFEKLLPHGMDYKKSADRCMVIFRFENGTVIPMSTNKNLVFPLDAAERMKSVVHEYTIGGIRHKEKKDKDVVKVIPDKIDTSKNTKDFRDAEEQKLCLNLAKAYSSGDTLKVLNAALTLDTYRIKVIDELRQENNRLSEGADRRVLWTERQSASRVVKILSEILGQRQNDIWNSIYCKLTINYHLPLEERHKLPLIDAVERSEWFLVYQAIIEVCEDKYLDVRRVFDKAEINTAGLERIVKGTLI